MSDLSNRTKDLIKNSALFAVAQMGAKVIVFFMVPFYTSILSPEEYGISDFLFTLRALLTPILGLCIADATLRFCFDSSVSKKSLLSNAVFIIGVGTVIAFVSIYCIRNTKILDEVKEYWMYVPILFSTNLLYNLLNMFARGVDKVKESAISGLLYIIIMVSSNIIFLSVFRWGAIGYVRAFLLSDIVCIAYLMCTTKAVSYIKLKIDVSLLRSEFNYSLPLVPNTLSWWLIDSFSRIIIKSNLNIASVGIYAATLRVPTILAALSDIFSQAWLLSALKDYGSEESKNFIREISKRFTLVLTLTTSFLVIFSHPIAKLLLKGEFADSWRLIPFMFLSVYLGAQSGFIGAIFSAEKKTSVLFKSTILGGLMSICLSLILINRYGLLGIALSTLVGYSLIWFLRLINLRKIITLGVSETENIFIISYLLLLSVIVYSEIYWCAFIQVASYCFLKRKDITILVSNILKIIRK